MSRKWRCRLRQTFFGLTDEYNEGIYEQIFFLKYQGAWSFSEAYSLPVGLRNWFVKRLVEIIHHDRGIGRGNTLDTHFWRGIYEPQVKRLFHLLALLEPFLLAVNVLLDSQLFLVFHL